MQESRDDWQWIRLDGEAVAALVDHARDSAGRSPTMDQRLEPRLRRAGAPKPPRGQPLPLADVDPAAVPAGVQVVVGEGLYLQSNGTDVPAPPVLHADGCDPARDPAWRANVEALAGAEPHVLFLPAAAVREVLDESDGPVWLGLCRDEERFAVEEYGLSAEPGGGAS